MWYAPALIASAFRPAPRSTGPTEPGVSSSPTLLVFPYPSCPYWLKPQQRTLPLSRIAQAWKSPALIATALRPAPRSIGPDRARSLVVADVVRGPVSELSVGSVAPAAHPAVVEQRAGERDARRDRDCLPSRAQVHGADRGRGLVVPDRRRVPVAERAVLAAAPAADGAVVEQGARVLVAGRDRDRLPPGADGRPARPSPESRRRRSSSCSRTPARRALRSPSSARFRW